MKGGGFGRRLLAVGIATAGGLPTGLAPAPCTPAGICTGADGEPWDLGPIGSEQVVDGPTDPTYNYQYAFSLYKNLDPVPQICQTFSIFGTNAARYDESSFGTCEQLGPDMNLADGSTYQFSARDETLTFLYGYSGNQLTVTLECSFGAGKGTPGAVTGTAPNFNVMWKTNYACEGGAAKGGSEGGGAWGMMFLIFFFLGSGMYVGGGAYYNNQTKNAVGVQALPHLEFWSTIPGLVKDGVTFSKAKYNERYGDGTPLVKPAAPLHGANAAGETTPVLQPEQGDADYGTATVSPAASTPTKKKKKKKPRTSSAGGETPGKEKKKRKKKPVEAIANGVEAKE
jgi:hypothetical protein|eukprot:COSAG02_NODE_2768_length_8063_cov_17.175163_5_plen_341_part_00